jgi:hypothetical protein
MDKNSKILLAVVIILLVVSVSLTYYRFFIVKDFTVINNEESPDLSE